MISDGIEKIIGGIRMNWTAAAIITNLLLWVVMFADIITDMFGGESDAED